MAVVAVGALLIVYTLYAANSTPGPVTSGVPSRFTANGKTYTFTYTATNEHQWTQGLMGKTLTNTTTMLFAFPNSRAWSFWMYNTSTSLDMIWVNATGGTGSVVYLVTSAQPCFNYEGVGCRTYTPSEPANYVIEAKAGFAAANGITLGTTIAFESA